MNLKIRLNWAAYVIFTLFVAITVVAQMYVLHAQLSSHINTHNSQLVQLVDAKTKPEQIYDHLAVTYQYERFSVSAPGSAPFSFVAETAINWPLVSSVFESTKLVSPQVVTVDNVEITYLLDVSPIINSAQQLLLLLVLVETCLYVLYSLMISSVIRRNVAQPLSQFAQALSRMSEFHFGGSEPHNVIDEMKPIGRALQKTRMELEGKYHKLTSQNRQLQQEAFNDELTGFGNRVLFNKEFRLLLDPEHKTIHTGLVCIIRTTQLARINKEHGFEAGDTYISKISDALRQSLINNSIAQFYRINGADFAVILPNLAEAGIDSFAKDLKTRLDEYQKSLDVESIAHIGIVNYRSGDTLADTLSNVDIAVSIAQTLQSNGWYLHKGSETQGSQQWKNTIDEVLENTKVTLLYQPIIPTRGEDPLYLELFTRFYDKNNTELPTQSLIAMAQRHDSATDIDKLIVTSITKAIQTSRLKGQTVGVKLTTSSVLSNDFLIWLERHLASLPEVARDMIFEISCNTVEQNHENTFKLIEILHKTGAKISLANFGITPLSFKQLKMLKPDFVKLDRSLTNNLVNDKDDQFYVKQLVDVTHQLRTQVIIIGIETEEERFLVEGLRVDGMQGYFISKPENISELVTSVHY